MNTLKYNNQYFFTLINNLLILILIYLKIIAIKSTSNLSFSEAKELDKFNERWPNTTKDMLENNKNLLSRSNSTEIVNLVNQMSLSTISSTDSSHNPVINITNYNNNTILEDFNQNVPPPEITNSSV